MKRDYKRTDKAISRYFMYDNEERTKAWRLDTKNDGDAAEFWVNGEPIGEVDPEITNAVLKALTALDLAFGALMIADKEIK